MILSVSRRTDVPAWYSDWFFERLRAGYADVRNPYRAGQVSRVPLTPDAVDGIVFWTKNPLPMLNRLRELGNYAYYFQFTLTPYDGKLEPRLPSKRDVLVPTFRQLSDLAGPHRAVWRYDPVILTEEWTMERHQHCFREMAEDLDGATDECIVSFVDDYACMRQRMRQAGGRAPTESEAGMLLGSFAETALEHGMKLSACCEAALLAGRESGKDAWPARCIDANRLSRIAGCHIEAPPDTNQRAGCCCAKSVDVGAYNTCQTGCVYCYATHSAGRLDVRVGRYAPDSSLLCDRLLPSDRVVTRSVRRYADDQTTLF